MLFRKRSLAQSVRDALGDGVDSLFKLNDPYHEAMRWLRDGVFLERCSQTVADYHAGDDLLTAKLLRGALRPMYSTQAALLHFAFTGASGSGKSDLVSTVSALLPEENVISYTSITPKDLWYSMREKVNGVYVMDPEKYRNKLIIVKEINDSKKFDAIKAFAELDEFKVEKHATASGAGEVSLEVYGPRALWITSVKSVGDDQVRRRFLNSVIDNSEENQQRKAQIITKNILNQTRVEDDPRTFAAQAGFRVLCNNEPVFTTIPNDAAELIECLNLALVERGYQPTQLKQLYSLAECAAVEKQFARDVCQVQTEDVLEAWYLLGFEDDHEIQVGGQWLEPLNPLRIKEEMTLIPIRV
jgi:energy-coupling factor transporter ATP-binding protein EcfA2